MPEDEGNVSLRVERLSGKIITWFELNRRNICNGIYDSDQTTSLFQCMAILMVKTQGSIRNNSMRHFSLDDIKDWIGQARKRLCFSDKTRPLPFNPYSVAGKYWFNLPFEDSVVPILNSFDSMEETPVHMRINKNGNYFAILDESQKKEVETLLNGMRPIVFLRDFLDCSIALSMNMSSPGIRTVAGELEYRMKYEGCEESRQKLMAVIHYLVEHIPLYSKADTVCCVPSRSGIMLPFAQELASELGMDNISGNINWKNNLGRSSKNCDSAEEKLNLCVERDIEIADISMFDGKRILLLDDLYQSGVSMQFTAMKLYEAGAKEIYGLSIVKSLSNS